MALQLKLEIINTIAICFYTLCTLIIMITAIVATKSWKEEIVEKRIKELNEEAYTLIEKIENKIMEIYSNEAYLAFEKEINNEIGYFFEGIAEDVIKLAENLRRSSQNIKYIEYFKDTVLFYSEKAEKNTDNDTGLEYDDYSDYSDFIMDFWSEYSYQTEDKLNSDLNIEFDKNIKEAKEYYDNQIIKFYK